ncbi:aminopeptidase P family N-terminal domain-containing protein [Bradyrhizobium sp. IC3069]|uniref:aminopeptidase P family N-terminal domain-containing protein n=1 Tax=unclassified Bradyrhizobium TaxID=2631580 RepID=UPI0031F62A68
MAMPKAPQAFREPSISALTVVKGETERSGIDVLVVTSPSNVTYLSGYTSKSAYVPQGLIVSLKQEEPTFFTRRMDAPAAMHQMFIDTSRVIGYAEDLIVNPDRDGFDPIIDFLHDNGLAGGGVGVEIKSISAQTAEKFRARMVNAKIVDFANGVHQILGIKSDLEIALMREAGPRMLMQA